MAKVIPFKGILYNPEKVNASLTVAPPYDIVTHDLKDELYGRSPNNIIRIDFGKDKDGDNDDVNRYTRAAGYLDKWLKEGVLVQDEKPSFYCYEISYSINGEQKKTRGVFAAVKIEDLGKGKIHPHEMTYSKPKSDRLNILRHCNANTSPIFSLYSSEEKTTSSIIEKTVRGKPYIEAKDDEGFIHRLWTISDPLNIEKISTELSDKDIFIADGHHRYETALEFRKEMQGRGLLKTGDEPFNYIMMFLANMEDDGLTLLPTHRIVEVDSDINIKSSLEPYFDINNISREGLTEDAVKQLMFNEMKKSIHTFGMFMTNADTYYTLRFNGLKMDKDMPECLADLDVSVLHKQVFEKLLNIDHFEYEMDPDIAIERAKKGSFEAVFFLNPTRIHDVRKVALAGHRMPPKSTYFYPKLLTGMVIYSFS